MDLRFVIVTPDARYPWTILNDLTRKGNTMETKHPREQQRDLIVEAIDRWMQARIEDTNLDSGELADEIIEGITWPVESD